VIFDGLEGILSKLLCAGLCDTMFTISRTLIGAVLTCPTDWGLSHWYPYAVHRMTYNVLSET